MEATTPALIKRGTYSQFWFCTVPLNGNCFETCFVIKLHLKLYSYFLKSLQKEKNFLRIAFHSSTIITLHNNVKDVLFSERKIISTFSKFLEKKIYFSSNNYWNIFSLNHSKIKYLHHALWRDVCFIVNLKKIKKHKNFPIKNFWRNFYPKVK